MTTTNSARPARDTGGALDQRHQCVPGEERLFLDRIVRAALGDRLGEHRLDRRVEFGGEAHPGDRIEPSA